MNITPEEFIKKISDNVDEYHGMIALCLKQDGSVDLLSTNTEQLTLTILSAISNSMIGSYFKKIDDARN
jgi:hypothetical protein